MTIKANRPSQELVDIVAGLRGTWHGGYAMVRCPAHADGKPSLSLRQGDRGILVHCFAGCTNEDVLRELRTVSRIRGAPPPNYRPDAGTGNVDRLWEQGVAIRGTLAERYLQARKLPLDLEDLRFHPHCPHKPKPHTEYKPALLAAVREGMQLTAIQRIFLDPVSGYRTEKVMLGRPGQGAWRQRLDGATTLALAEGMEDAGAFLKLHGIVTWAALGASRLHLLSIPDQVTNIIIAEDNNKEGRLAARQAWKTYREQGRKVTRMTPRPCGDWAEVNEKA